MRVCVYIHALVIRYAHLFSIMLLSVACLTLHKFLGAFENFRKTTVSFVMSLIPSVRRPVRMEQLGSH